MTEHIDHEKAAILPFENIARENHLIPLKGQGNDNKIFLGGKLNFQFGDLRVDTKKHHVVIEVESAGGVTNLVKYWYCLADKTLSKQILMPIILIHLFRQTSPNDYKSHLNLWNFMWGEMQKALVNRIQAFPFVYCELPSGELSGLEKAIKEFKKSLTPI